MRETNSCDAASQKLLQHCEVTIKLGLKHFLAVGQALATIREKRLYKLKQHSTFEGYCQSQWNITRAHANNLILAFAAEQELSTVVDTPVLKSERQARKYRQLDGESKQEVKQAIATGAEMDEALSAVTEKKRPSDKLRVKGLVLKVCTILNSTSEEREAYGELQPVIAWCNDFEKREQAFKPVNENDLAWMTDLKAKYGRAA